ncbi:MAG TPA: ABC transporter permease [Gemmatimonadales bacterium]|jgi:putative ABC transport system permease protein|nr:ABC transporter permease [Gemmatimonadales bacterium]
MTGTSGRGNVLARAAEGVLLALDAIRASKTRAALTILGVAIGVMVVIGMASMITGIRDSVSQMVEQAGPTTFVVLRYFQAGINISDGSDEMSPWRRRPYLNRDDAEAIRRLPGIEDVSVSENADSRVSYQATNLGDVSINGTDASWMRVSGGNLLEGRNFTPIEAASGSFVTVINDNAAQTLFPGLDPVGKTIKIFGLPFTVVGTYQDPKGVFTDDKSPKIVVPHETLLKNGPVGRGWMDISVFPRPEITQADAMDQVTTAMRLRRGLKPAQENNFDLVSGDKFLESFNSITAGFFLVMLVLSSVGLMVGGVGVVAIMMISVTERTREIGVRKALGATRGEILFQFLVEAATLTLIGGLCGMALGTVIAFLVNRLTPIPAVVPLWSVAAAIVASTVTGIFFGIYPANKAARLDPVEALRYE